MFTSAPWLAVVPASAAALPSGRDRGSCGVDPIGDELLLSSLLVLLMPDAMVAVVLACRLCLGVLEEVVETLALRSGPRIVFRPRGRPGVLRL